MSNNQDFLFEKLFYKIGEVSKVVGVKEYVIRYWESEFPFILPQKNTSGQRRYTKKEIEIILLIKKLLYDEKYTIEGVRQKFRNGIDIKVSTTSKDKNMYLRNVREKIKVILENI